ncbi:tumor necrosis factor receptor superfamily member 1A isoform X3 [Onychostoma macrolepis]|uniref:tumor necrosis factor receptor superfamily member 1A isoform X3 n=1 Tax=Onychostoma macrolepis TaxID=369639 RepID=UPI00272A2623|nr:tumor necrosis factor receptor superfamily member 1A isoform X3 [Onychostoma macrolepis]
MTVSTLCLDSVFILFIVSQCQCQIKIPLMTDGRCSAGYYKLQQVCVKCASGFFSELPGRLEQCSRCTTCDSGANEVENTSCTPTQNRVCACKPGFYKSNGHCKHCNSCQNCTECLNCKKNCNQETAIKTTAVGCELGDFPESGKCQSCVKYKCKNESCKSFCSAITPERQDFPDPLLLVLLVIVTLLGGLFSLFLIWFYRRRWLCCRARIWNVGKHPDIQIQPGKKWSHYQNFTSNQLPTQHPQWRFTEHHGPPDSKRKPKIDAGVAEGVLASTSALYCHKSDSRDALEGIFATAFCVR